MFEDNLHYVNGMAHFTLNQAAKFLDFQIGRTKLLNQLRKWGILLKNNEPSQHMIDRKYMVCLLKEIEVKGKVIKTIPVTLVTIEGLYFLKKLIPRKLKQAAPIIPLNNKTAA